MAPIRIPGVTYAPAPRAEEHASVLEWNPSWVVLHDTGNNTSNRLGEASYAHTRTDDMDKWTSAHAYTDGGGITGSLRLDRQAWAAKATGNRKGLHIEMCRTAAGVSAATRAVTAPLVRQLCQMAGIPMVKLTPAELRAGKKGVVGHLDFTLAGMDKNDHQDPGPSFPWAEFMALVTNEEEDVQLSEPLGQPLFVGDPDYPAPWMAGTVGQMLAYTRQDAHYARYAAARSATEVVALRHVIDTLAGVINSGGGSVDTAGILAGLDERLAAFAEEQAAEMRDAVADLGEGGAAQVRADA
jgi:hypothetical protein